MSNIMIVDESAKFRKGLKAVLYCINSQINIDEASDGGEFFARICKASPDIVFMDVKLPGTDGVQATRLARRLYPGLTIIGFSSYENESYRNKMIDAGANGYLLKSEDNYESLSYIISHPGLKYYHSHNTHQQEC